MSRSQAVRAFIYKVLMWIFTISGSRLFLCDRMVIVRLIACVVRHKITMDEIVEAAERAAEAADRGYHV